MSLPLLMSFDMDRPLNKAHWHERNAEVQLKQEKWDEAEKSYNEAAVLMRQALDEVSTSSMALPLQMQIEQLEKMRNVIKIKRREAANFQNSVGPNLEDELPSQQSLLEDKKYRANSTDKSTGISQIHEASPKATRQNSMPNTWQLIQMAEDGDRPKDSLLPLFLRRDVGEEHLFPSSKMIPKSQEALLEEYRTRLNLMQDMMKGLVKEIDDKEQENESLKEEVEGLRLEVSTLSERLEIYEGPHNLKSLHFAETNNEQVLQQKPADDMTASMLITQPESYFEFDRKDLETELQDATRENRQDEKHRKATHPSGRRVTNRTRLSKDHSVEYQDLDDGINPEVPETISDSPPETNAAGSSLKLSSLAGLPPLSPVHFELDDKDNIVRDKHGDIF